MVSKSSQHVVCVSCVLLGVVIHAVCVYCVLLGVGIHAVCVSCVLSEVGIGGEEALLLCKLPVCY